MHLIDTDRAAALDLIASITSHIPIGDSLGRLIVADGGQRRLLVDRYGEAAVYGRDDTHGGTWRIAELECGDHELTVWLDGAEISRRIVHP